MKFVDRTKEIDKLTKVLHAAGSRLVVIFGRRRIGKSTLVGKVLRPEEDIFFQADETQMHNQLYRLAMAIENVLPGFASVVYPHWTALLTALNYRVTAPMTLCLDEFPYLVKSFHALPSVIQHFWDTASPRFNLILCGSSQQSTYADILNARSPLYGRADCIIHLQPLEAGYIQEAMELGNAEEAVTNYAFWGGVPRYWRLCMEAGSWQDGVRELLLNIEGTLIDEPDRLLRDELRDLMLSRTLLSMIGNGVHRLSEIAARLGKTATELSAPLRRLVDMGYITREIPFGTETKNAKKSVYHLGDPFMDAYFSFVTPNLSLISMRRDEAVWKQVENRLPAYVGRHWESLCRRAVSGALIDGVTYGPASRWWGTVYDRGTKGNEQMELDVVALSIHKKHLLVGECKWTQAEAAAPLVESLRQKVARLPFAQEVEEIHYVLFLRTKPIDESEVRVFLPQDVLGMLR